MVSYRVLLDSIEYEKNNSENKIKLNTYPTINWKCFYMRFCFTFLMFQIGLFRIWCICFRCCCCRSRISHLDSHNPNSNIQENKLNTNLYKKQSTNNTIWCCCIRKCTKHRYKIRRIFVLYSHSHVIARYIMDKIHRPLFYVSDRCRFTVNHWTSGKTR